jgi:hypothetical protein
MYFRNYVADVKRMYCSLPLRSKRVKSLYVRVVSRSQHIHHSLESQEALAKGFINFLLLLSLPTLDPSKADRRIGRVLPNRLV